jgi:hypothetical protein
MAVNPPRIDELVAGASEDRPDVAPVDEGIQPVGLFSGAAKPAARSAAHEAIKPLRRKGARTSPDYVVTEENVVPPAPQTDTPEAVVPPVQPDIDTPPVAKEPTIEPPGPVSEERLTEIREERARQIGTARQAPSPTKAQRLAGVEEGPARTTFYDDDELAATVQAVAAKTVAETGTQSIQSLFDKAFEAGVPKETLDRMFKGINLQSEIGVNKLAVQLAGLQALHDESAARVDALMARAAAGELTDAGKLELRQQLAQHEIIFTQLSGAKSDVARSMNVFKNIRDREVGAVQVKAALDSFGGDDQLRALAEKYVTTSGGRAAKNKIIKAGVARKLYESWIYMAQSVVLTAFDTHFYNALGGALSIAADLPERAVAVPIGATRQRIAKMLGAKYNEDRYYGDQILARATGFKNGLIDGIHMAAEKIRQNDPSAKDASMNPVSSAYWANTEIGTFRGKVISTGDMDNAAGKMVDAVGTIYSLPFHALGAGDEIFGGIAARMELHEMAYDHAARLIDEVIANGGSMKEAIEHAEKETLKFLTERPADVEASVQGWRKQVTLQADIDRTNAAGKGFHAANKFISHPFVKPIVLFSKTVTNIGIEAGARSPLFFASPRFYTEFKKGGRYKDLALSRAATGSALMLAGYNAAYYGRTTGQGPADTEDRKALRAAGWQPFAMRFGEGELSSENIRRLRTILGEDAVTAGTGEFTGYTYVSLRRLEPVSTPLLMGAAFADAMKFRQYDPDDTFAAQMAAASVAAIAEYSENLSSLQAMNEIASIMNQRQTDGGDKALAIVDGLAKRYASTAIAGTPGVGLVNSTFIARIEAMMDPAVRSTMMTAEQIEASEEMFGTVKGVRGFVEAYNRMMSRVPVMSESRMPVIDEYGNTPGLDKTLPYTPLTATVAERNELTEMLAAINHGYSVPSKSYFGIPLSDEAYYRRNDLAANKIMIDGMRLAEANLSDINSYLDDRETMGLRPQIGVMQSIVNSNVSAYREAAHERMFGKTVKGPDGNIMHTGEAAGTQYGLPDDKIEFPGIAAEMVYQKNKRLMYGN